MHIMYFFNIIGNTFPIALFVLIISQIFLFIYPAYIKTIHVNWFYEFGLHWLPILLIKPSFEHMNYLYFTLLTYILAFNQHIVKIYKDPIEYLNE